MALHRRHPGAWPVAAGLALAASVALAQPGATAGATAGGASDGPVDAASAAGPEASDSQRLERSWRQWQKTRALWADQYRYQVRWQSAFGFGHVTGIEVRQGRVVRRDFQAWRREPDSARMEVIEQWTQSAAQLAAPASAGAGRDDQRAAAPLTLEQLYARCRAQLRQPPGEGQRQVLQFDALGLLKACYRFNPQQVDDSPQTGVPFIELTPLS